MNLLLVEDNGAFGRALAKALRSMGHSVTLLHSCEDARHATGYYEVGLFDIALADGDGIELCRSLLRRGSVGSALFCSGSIDDALIERAAQVARVVAKEASFAELCAAISSAARRARSELQPEP